MVSILALAILVFWILPAFAFALWFLTALAKPNVEDMPESPEEVAVAGSKPGGKT